MQDDVMDMLAARSAMYQFFARVLLKELDDEALKHIKAMPWASKTGVEIFDKGLVRYQSILSEVGITIAFDDLAADYARAFLGAGVVDDVTAYPYESVYTSADHLVAQDAFEAVQVVYREAGFKKTMSDLFDDHVGLELSFMAASCERALEANTDHDKLAFNEAMTLQERFFAEHLFNWVPAFCADVKKLPIGDFYKAIAQMLLGFMESEKVDLLGH